MTDEYVPPVPIESVHELGIRFLETINADHRTHCALCQHWPFGEETGIHDFMGGESRLTDPALYSEDMLGMSKDQLLAEIYREALWALWYLLIKDTRPSPGTTAPRPNFNGWAMSGQAVGAAAIAQHVLLPWRYGADLKQMNLAQLRAVAWILADSFENLC